MKIEKITCKDVMSHICESLGEDLDSPKCVEIKSHLNGCPDCTKYFKSVEKTIDFYKKYNVELPEDAHNKLIDLLGLNDE